MKTFTQLRFGFLNGHQFILGVGDTVLARYDVDGLIYRAQVTQFIDRHSLLVGAFVHRNSLSIFIPSIHVFSSIGFVRRLWQHREGYVGQCLRMGPVLRYSCIPSHQVYIVKYKRQRRRRT